MEKGHGEKDMDVTNSARGIWLVKVRMKFFIYIHVPLLEACCVHIVR